MEIIQFPQSSLDGGSKWLQACTHSPITKADDGQLSEKEHQRKLRLALFFNLDGNTLVMVINVNGTLAKWFHENTEQGFSLIIRYSRSYISMHKL